MGNKAIRFIPRSQINDSKWNQCVVQGSANLVYAHTQYLDGICEVEWHGLVYGDYEAVFPLPIKKLFGVFPYVVQPKFCKQLGAFGSNKNCNTADFICAIPRYFFRVKLHLNPYFDSQKPSNSQGYKSNFILDLTQPVQINKDGQKNIKAVSGFHYCLNKIEPEAVIHLYQRKWGDKNASIRDSDYNRLIKTLKTLGPVNDFKTKNLGYLLVSAHTKTISQEDSNSDTLLGAGLFLISTQGNQRFSHFVMGAPNTKFPESDGIMHGIIDFAITQCKSKVDVFDFEGSSIPSVAAFYKKFNPIDKPYRFLTKGI